jgi:hypothetical protein
VGFDKNDPAPLVQTERRTTKVNFGIAIGVLLFFAFGVAAVIWMRHLNF